MSECFVTAKVDRWQRNFSSSYLRFMKLNIVEVRDDGEKFLLRATIEFESAVNIGP